MCSQSAAGMGRLRPFVGDIQDHVPAGSCEVVHVHRTMSTGVFFACIVSALRVSVLVGVFGIPFFVWGGGNPQNAKT